MAQSFASILAAINSSNLTIDEARELSRALNAAVTRLQHDAKRELRIGQTVSFRTRDGGIVYGTVKRFLTKNVEIIDNGTGMRWRVSPSLVKPM